jgi:hypothetical protein
MYVKRGMPPKHYLKICKKLVQVFATRMKLPLVFNGVRSTTFLGPILVPVEREKKSTKEYTFRIKIYGSV